MITAGFRIELVRSDRAQTATYLGEIRAWSDFLKAASDFVGKAKILGGANFRVLLPRTMVTSPTLAAQIESVLKQIRGAKWHEWEWLRATAPREGREAAFGRYVSTVYRPKGSVILRWMRTSWPAGGAYRLHEKVVLPSPQAERVSDMMGTGSTSLN